MPGIYPYLDKITAFVTRSGSNGMELLLFEHPNAGIQIPAGTVEEGEPFEQAVLRELMEETGLNAGDVRLRASLGWRDELPPDKTHVMRKASKAYSRPDPTSFDWIHLPRGISVRLLRREPGFAQVTYEEGDRYPDPIYTSYQATGWVPEEVLAEANRRHFFHLEALPGAPDFALGAPGGMFARFTDHHTFRPFWASMEALPEIIPPQRAWLDYVLVELGYIFLSK